MRPILLLLLTAACSSVSSGASSDAGDTTAARALVTRLETEARSLARAEGCASADQCRMAPVGERPCGGPRTYVPYCAASTDSVALYRKLDELKAAEMRLNQLTHASSTCEFRTPAIPALVGGRCSAP